jgi:prevent-host-death family protein
MITIGATEARNNIRKLWSMAHNEPVMVTSFGKPVAVVLSSEEYARLTPKRFQRRLGFLKDMFEGVDVDAVMSTSLDDMFSEYMP